MGTVMAISDEEQALPERSEIDTREPLFNPEQQTVFNRAFRKREAKLRREYEVKLTTATRDLLETAGLTEQLLARCVDRMSREDAKVIADGLKEIKNTYGSNRS